MNWLIFTIITSVTYGFFNVFMKLAADFGINSKIGTLVLNLTAFLMILSYLLILKNTELKSSKLWSYGLVFAVLAGLMAAIGNTSRFISYDLEAPLSISQLISSFGSMTVTYLVGFIFLKEPLSVTKMFGLVLGYIGIYLAIRS